MCMHERGSLLVRLPREAPWLGLTLGGIECLMHAFASLCGVGGSLPVGRAIDQGLGCGEGGLRRVSQARAGFPLRYRRPQTIH